MTDETCCGACGYPVHATKEMACDWCRQAADRIEALTEQLAAARRDAEEAEAYARELEKELNTCRMAQAVMDNTVADLEAKLAKVISLADAMASAIEDQIDICDASMDEQIAVKNYRATLAEIKGESHE